jgi:hypothetical protein
MTKNTTIIVLVIVLVLGFGYYFAKNNNKDLEDDTTPPTTTQNNTSNSNPTPSTKPDAPTVQTSSTNSTSTSTASLNGAVNPNGAYTTYWFEYGDTTALGSRSVAPVIGSGYYLTPTPAFLTGLRTNTTYYYRLSAKNVFGTVNGSTFTFQTNSTPAPKGKAPVTRTNGTTGVSRNTATITGEVNPNGFATSYWFEYGKDKEFGFVTQFQATNSGYSYMAVSAAVSGLEPLTKYYYRLNGQNQYGTVNGTTMSFTTTGPTASSKPEVHTSSATNISSSDATFVGTINPNGDETTYWFEYSNDSLLNNLIGSGTPKGTAVGSTNQTVKINVNGLSSNTKYYYRLVGRNDNGTVYGDSVSFTTKK